MFLYYHPLGPRQSFRKRMQLWKCQAAGSPWNLFLGTWSLDPQKIYSCQEPVFLSERAVGRGHQTAQHQKAWETDGLDLLLDLTASRAWTFNCSGGAGRAYAYTKLESGNSHDDEGWRLVNSHTRKKVHAPSDNLHFQNSALWLMRSIPGGWAWATQDH